MKSNYLFFAICIILSNSTLFGQTTTTITGQAPLRIETPKNWNKNKAMNDAALYNAPANCVIISATLNEIQRNGPVQRSVDFVQGGSRFVSVQEMNDAFSSAYDLVTTLKIQGKEYLDLKAKLDTKYSEYEKVQNTIEASHATIQHKATVNGNGFGNGRSWYEGDVTVKIYCPDEYFRNKTKLNENLNSFIQKYSDSISNNNTNNIRTNDNNVGNTGNLDTEKTNNNLWIYIIGGIIVLLLLILIFKKRK
tara:strand:- start:23 stop:772 length:750 start_codon:yes stop_codon:yes gene_type:complete